MNKPALYKVYYINVFLQQEIKMLNCFPEFFITQKILAYLTCLLYNFFYLSKMVNFKSSFVGLNVCNC